MATGRTVSRFTNLVIADAANALRDIPINSLSVCGVQYEEMDVGAFQDAVKSALPGMPDAPLDITGPFDTTAAATASGTGAVPALSGSHTVLSALNGGFTPRSVDVQIGIRATWATNDPQFGITATATSGYLVTNYTVNLDDMTYAAALRLYPGSSLPAWGTEAEAAS